MPVVVATDHIPCVLKLAHELERRRRVNGLLDGLFGVSESVRQSLLECDLIAPKRAFVVENGVEEIFPHMSRAQARRELDLPSNMPVALFLGRLVEQKDPYVLLHALALLNKRGLRIMALFAGDGDVRHATEREAWRVGVGEQVRFLGNCANIAPLFAATDALAMPSRFEGMPLAALEAMSYSLPIVGCDAPGVRDVVTHEENGWLAPIADPEAFAEGLALALTRPKSGIAGDARRDSVLKPSIRRRQWRCARMKHTGRWLEIGNTPRHKEKTMALSKERIGAILHLAGQIDLHITELSEEMESLTIRLENLRAMSAQIFAIQDGTLSDEEVQALTQLTDSDDSSPEHILDEIIEGEISHSPE